METTGMTRHRQSCTGTSLSQSERRWAKKDAHQPLSRDGRGICISRSPRTALHKRGKEDCDE
jgi:hypothetical protein